MAVSQPNLDSFTIRRVRVVTAGTAVRGPAVSVPDGFAVIVRMRRHTGAPDGYVAENEANVADDALRSVLKDNDSIGFLVKNMNAIWVDSNTNTIDFEFFVEQ